MNNFKTVVLFVFVATDIFHFSNLPSFPYVPEKTIVLQPDSLNAKFRINSSLAELNLKGKVRKLTETQYDGVEISGKIQRGIVGEKKISFFDTSGYMTRIQYYPQSNTKSQMQTLFHYDVEHKQTEECLYVELSGKSILWRKVIVRYNFKGKKIEKEEYIHSGVDSLLQTSTIIYSYDSNDLECNAINYSSITGLNGNNIDTSRENTIYNKKGNLQEKIHSDQMGRIIKSKYKYDKDSNLIEIHNYFPIGTLLVTKPDKSRKNTNTYRPEPNEEVTRFTYLKFDKMGNWLLELKSEYFIHTYTQREIEYY